MYVYCLCAWCPWDQKRVSCPGTGVIDCCKLFFGRWEPNPGLPQEQQLKEAVVERPPPRYPPPLPLYHYTFLKTDFRGKNKFLVRGKSQFVCFVTAFYIMLLHILTIVFCFFLKKHLITVSIPLMTWSGRSPGFFFFYYEGFYAKNKNKAVPLMVSKLVCLLEFGRPFLKMHILGHMSIDCISSGVWQVLVWQVTAV